MQIMATMGRRDIRAVSLVGAGHFMSHFYQLTLPPLLMAQVGTAVCVCVS